MISSINSMFSLKPPLFRQFSTSSIEEKLVWHHCCLGYCCFLINCRNQIARNKFLPCVSSNFANEQLVNATRSFTAILRTNTKSTPRDFRFRTNSSFIILSKFVNAASSVLAGLYQVVSYLPACSREQRGGRLVLQRKGVQGSQEGREVLPQARAHSGRILHGVGETKCCGLRSGKRAVFRPIVLQCVPIIHL
jgi:hypothetical protein